MTNKILTLALFASATVAMTVNINAEIITSYTASFELEEPTTTGNANDSTASDINSVLAPAGTTPGPVTNSVYDTRSTQIGGNIEPHLSGIVPSGVTQNDDGLFYVASSATKINTSINQVTSAYQEFSIEVNDEQLDLDTLSFNYWATESAVNDFEGPTDYTYETRVLASVEDATGATTRTFSNLGVTETTGERLLRITNPDNTTQFTSRDNVVEFDLASLGTLTSGETVNFRIAFADYDTNGSDNGPDDGSHFHRFDNVEITSVSAVPEPSALCFLISSFGLLGLRRRR